MNIAYIRVSTVHQHSTDGRQSEDAFPVKIDRKFVDHGFSGGNADRPALKEMLGYIRENDNIWVLDISRLARSMKDFLAIAEAVTAKGATLHFVKEGLTLGGNDDPSQKLFIQILTALAEWELNIQRDRRRDGIERAKAANRYANVGRKPTLSAERIAAIKNRIAAGESISQISKDEHISRTTVYRYCV